MTKFRRWVTAFEVFALYLIAGASCLVVSSSLPKLVQHFEAPLVSVAAIGSAFALGRVATVLFMGWLTDKLGPRLVMALGLSLILCFLFGMASAASVAVAVVCGVLGGIGMGTQDAAGPVILLAAFPQHYASAMGVAQGFFGVGCFLPPLVMGLVLGAGQPFTYTYYIIAALCVPMLALLPFLKWEKRKAPPHSAPAGGEERQGSRWLWLLLSVVMVFYCATCGSVSLYSASYATSLGIPESMAVNVLTLYSMGGMVGAMVFAGVLRRKKPADVLCLNLAGALLAIVLTKQVKNFFLLGAGYFMIGAFLNVLFNVGVTLAVQHSPARAGKAGPIIAMINSAADVVLPLVTGVIATVAGVGVMLWFAAAMALVALLFALLYRSALGRRLPRAQTPPTPHPRHSVAAKDNTISPGEPNEIRF